MSLARTVLVGAAAFAVTAVAILGRAAISGSAPFA